ncbi:MAG: NUDIX domain-containing protein [Chloroflexi bacterium]|nr:NUDIX domain-containing protein [Chloroflexota bacterium]
MVEKVVAYITREKNGNRELLVFKHSDYPDAGIQVPAGTVEPGELPEQALWREVSEETGHTGFTLARRLTTYEYRYQPTGEWSRRHVYHLTAPTYLPGSWRHGEKFGTPDQITFDFYWAPLDSLPALSAGLGDHLHEI